MTKTFVGLLYGGRSVEHDISLLSAKNILHNIDKALYDISLIGIDKSGKWFLCNDISEPIANGEPLSLVLDANKHEFFTSIQRLKMDVIFPILHGTDGEDGTVQGLFQSMGIACVGSGVLGSAASMDKLLAKRVLLSAGLPVTPFLAINHHDRNRKSYSNIIDELGLPLIVKPANLGSSVGVTKVEKEDDFESAIALAFTYDDSLLVEKFIKGREVECAILGNERPLVSMAGEVKLSPNYSFYSFKAKYSDPDSAEIIIPANMPDTIHDKIKSLSLEAFKLLNCHDLARVDLFVTEDNTVYINEINTLPGFTDISMYPLLMQHEGIEYKELMTKLIEMALKRHQERSRISTSYDSKL